MADRPSQQGPGDGWAVQFGAGQPSWVFQGRAVRGVPDLVPGVASLPWRVGQASSSRVVPFWWPPLLIQAVTAVQSVRDIALTW